MQRRAGDVFTRNASTGDLVLEDVLFFGAGLDGLKRDYDTREPTRNHRSASCAVLRLFDVLTNGFAVSSHGLTNVGLDLEFATHTVDDDVEE